MKKQMKNSAFILAVCMAVSAGTLSCTDEESRHFEGVHAFKVTITDLSGEGFGTEAQPLKMRTSFDEDKGAYRVSVKAEARDITGQPVTNYNEKVKISAEPGQLSETEIQFVNGVAETTVAIRYAFGTTRIWVEDTETKPLVVDMVGGQCPAGTAKVDGFEGQCFRECLNGKTTEDGASCDPSYATGASAQMVFEPQTIRMIQYNPDRPDGSSPLLKEYGQIKALRGHDLVVTNVVSTGFYVTDLGDADYNSIFIFTFSQPGRVDIGDRVCEVSGGIAEFTGMTQLQFPSWGIQNKEQSTAEDIDPAPEDGETGVESCIDRVTGKERPCTEEELEAKHALIDCWDVYNDREGTKEEKKSFGYIAPPEPKAITDPNFFGLNNTDAIEALESSVVTVQNVRLSTEFIDCDDNGNSKIESGTAEADCRTSCTGNVRCTELSSLTSYDQWRAWTIEKNGELSVASSSLINGFDITSETWQYPSVVDSWLDNGCSRNSDGTMTCDACYEWKDPATKRRMIRCPERHLFRLTGNLKQVLPGCSGANSNTECYASKFKKNSMIMKVIEPRFKNDLIFDTEYNNKAQIDFQECRADTREGGCLDACKLSGLWCTCDNYANDYRMNFPETGKPSKCASRE